MIHDEPHPRAGQRVLLERNALEFWVEDWWDRVNGKSWREGGPIAAVNYAARVRLLRLPTDDEVVYGKVAGLGCLFHSSELAKADAPTEQEMRESEAPWPESLEELSEYVKSLVDRPHDYGTCCYAMSLAAVAAMNYVGSALGATGFQASCADLDILRRTRRMKGPFGIVKAEDMLYPQCDIKDQVNTWLTEWKPWAAEQARKKIEEMNGEKGFGAHPNVLARWKELAESDTEQEKETK